MTDTDVDLESVTVEDEARGPVAVVQSIKSSLKDKRSRKIKGKSAKKRVRFSDTDEASERIPFCRRFVRFFHFLWQCTRNTVQAVLSESCFVFF